MPSEPTDARAIRKATQRLLLKAGVDPGGCFPTPVDDIVAAAGLIEPAESLLSDGALAEAPLHIREAVRWLRRKVRAVLDRKTHEVHVDPSIQVPGRIAFHKLHEVTHEILPWQAAVAYADDDETLSPAIRRGFEREASFGAAELLFQNALFAQMASDEPIGMAAVVHLANRFGASYHAAFRRFIETHRNGVAGMVLDPSPNCQRPLSYRRHEAPCSVPWARTFGDAGVWPPILPATMFQFLELARIAAVDRTIAKGTWRLATLDNRMVELNIEVWSNSYNIFVLLWRPTKKVLLRHRRILVAH